MKEDMRMQLLEMALEIVKADTNKKLTTENIIIVYRQLVHALYMPTGI